MILLSAACAWVVAASPAAGPDPHQAVPDEQDRIHQVAKDWQTAYNAKDAAGVAALYAEDGYYLSAHVLAHGRQQIQAYFQKGIDAGGHIDEIRVLTIARSCDLAYSVGTYQATNSGQIYRGRIVVVLRKVADRWLMAAHEVVVADQP
jgi:uncharacterized protein (TIGR02246 family)